MNEEELILQSPQTADTPRPECEICVFHAVGVTTAHSSLD